MVSVALAWKPAAGTKDWIRKPSAVNCSSCSQTSSPVTLGAGWQISAAGVVVGVGLQLKKQSWLVSVWFRLNATGGSTGRAPGTDWKFAGFVTPAGNGHDVEPER